MLPDQGAVYYPEELSLLGQVLDQVVQSLPRSMATPHNRAAIAKNILAYAATGERDPGELRLAALIDLKVTVAASQTRTVRRSHNRLGPLRSPPFGLAGWPLRSMTRKSHP
jgi:hypothetical protein